MPITSKLLSLGLKATKMQRTVKPIAKALTSKKRIEKEKAELEKLIAEDKGLQTAITTGQLSNLKKRIYNTKRIELAKRIKYLKLNTQDRNKHTRVKKKLSKFLSTDKTSFSEREKLKAELKKLEGN